MSIFTAIRSRGRLVAALGLGAAALVAAGCGGGGSAFADADLANGEAKFASCAGCHSLEAVGAKGTDRGGPDHGPSLDDAFRAARQAGMDEQQFAGVVHRWIQIAQMPMPRNLVEGQDAIDVAAFVASVAGKDDESPVRAAVPAPPEAPDPPRQAIDGADTSVSDD